MTVHIVAENEEQAAQMVDNHGAHVSKRDVTLLSAKEIYTTEQVQD
jgi:hypothetical protein